MRLPKLCFLSIISSLYLPKEAEYMNRVSQRIFKASLVLWQQLCIGGLKNVYNFTLPNSFVQPGVLLGRRASTVPQNQRWSKVLAGRLIILRAVHKKHIPYRLQPDQRPRHSDRQHFNLIFVFPGHAKPHQSAQPELALPYGTVNLEEFLHNKPFLQIHSQNQGAAACSN